MGLESRNGGFWLGDLVGRALFGVITLIGHALGGARSVRAQCHRCFAKQKKPHGFLRPCGCVYLLSITAYHASLMALAHDRYVRIPTIQVQELRQ